MNDYLQLIYVRRENIRNKNTTTALINGKYTVEEKEDKCITVIKESNYINGLWGEKISDCYAIVGENGSGKTQLMNMLMDMFYYEKNTKIKCPYNFFALFENVQTGKLLYHYSNIDNDFRVVDESGESICKLSQNDIKQIRSKYKVAYVHNALSRRDYMIDALCDYNFSLGGLIKHDFKLNMEMHYSDQNIDRILNYFEKQQFQIIYFIYELKQRDREFLPLPLPEKIEISFADNGYDWDYIINEVKKLKWEIGTEAEELEKAYMFEKKIHEFFSSFGNSWINQTIERLIINCFKEVVVAPIVTKPDTRMECKMFWDLFDEIDRKRIRKKRETVYQLVCKFFYKLKNGIQRNQEYVDRYIKFIKWLEMQQEKIEENFVNPYTDGIEVPVNAETSQFMKELIKFYRTVSFEFPFYTFSFDVSTGEYYFLTLFSQLYSIVNKSDGTENVFDYTAINENTKNILLLLDEPDLSLHPRWQRNFIYWLTKFINSNYNGVKVQIIIATHSPILLSDFPSTNVLYLSKEKNENNEEYKLAVKNNSRETFGCNIHTLFLNSFFLENCGTMGMFAEGKINELADYLLNEENDDLNEEYAKKMIDCIGEGILKNRLEELFIRKFEISDFSVRVKKKKENSAFKALELLKKQRSELDELISELEINRDDKN